METTTTHITNKIVDSYTEFRDDLIKQGRKIKLEITAETYESAIHPATEAHGEIYSWLFVAEHHEGFTDRKWEAGKLFYPKSLSLDELKEIVGKVKADPFSLIIPYYAEQYTRDGDLYKCNDGKTYRYNESCDNLICIDAEEIITREQMIEMAGEKIIEK